MTRITKFVFKGGKLRKVANVLAAGLALVATQAPAVTVLPDFSAATFVAGTTIDNPFFPLDPTFQAWLRAEGVDDEGEDFTEETRLSYGGPGRTILGVQTTVQRDFAFEDDLLVEDTFDYYAQDTNGNVWYMGEDVINYIYDDDDNLVDTNNSSAWIAGENGALPGYIMPADPVVGMSYFQEFSAADGALDEASIFATGLTIMSGDTVFSDVLATLETSSIDPDAREFKFYARGVGLIRIEEGLDGDFANPELVFERIAPSVVPLPAGFSLMLAGMGALAGLRSLRRRA